MITVRFVGQFNADGDIRAGYTAQWREDQESLDPVEAARKILALNGNRKGYPRFFTWVQSYTHEETKEWVDNKEYKILAGYQGVLGKEEIHL